MKQYKVGDIIEDKNGRVGLITAVYNSPFVTYYIVLIDGETFHLQAEDLI